MFVFDLTDQESIYNIEDYWIRDVQYYRVCTMILYGMMGNLIWQIGGLVSVLPN